MSKDHRPYAQNLFYFLICLMLVHIMTVPCPGGEADTPFAFLFPAELSELAKRLQREDVEVHELREDIVLDVETYVMTATDPDQHSIGVSRIPQCQARLAPAGTLMVKSAQKYKQRVLELLDPLSEKNLLREPELQDILAERQAYPLMMLREAVPITHGKVRPLADQRKLNQPVTFETVYGPKTRVNFSGSPIRGLTWLPEGDQFLQVKQGRLYRVEAATGRMTPFFDPNALRTGLSRLPAFDEKTADAWARRTRLPMNPARTAVLINMQDDLYYCRLDGTETRRLTHSDAPEKYATFSPSGDAIAFVREGNLYVVDIGAGRERALTQDGGGAILNGEADWVYYEEVFNRAAPRVFWWSPDSRYLAFMRFDDTRVNDYTVVNNVTNNQTVEVAAYPKAGDLNPEVKLGVVAARGGAVRWIELEDYLPGSYLITRVGWFPNSQRVYFYLQDRAQTWLDFMSSTRQGRDLKVLFRETTPAWVSIPARPVFLQDDSFLCFSERSGWKHLYWYDQAGKPKRQLTHGAWEVRRLNHVDEAHKVLYVTGTRDSSLAENLYRVHMDANDVERLTRQPGHHRVDVSPTGNYFTDSWSSQRTPTQVALFDNHGKRVRMLDTNPVYKTEEYRFGTYEQFQIKTADGFALEASLVKPADFDPGRRYPVWFMTYAGPHAPSIRDTWSGGRARDHMLAEMGILVFRCDPRSASGKGACSAWTAYRQLGVQELADITEAIEWLKAQPFVDPMRVGMSGHSYGGFMTAYAMTHSQLFCAGIAGAPVTDWRLYDTIYTERYMDLPQNNPEGYKKTSVVEAAEDLHGRLLLIHGAIDDNVHVENTYKLVRALQRADRDFDLMIYPPARHGIGGMHYAKLTVDFIKSSLGME